ncbi:hypothetical protein [Mucilaginibacter sp.]
MKIEPQQQETDIYKDLTPLEQKTRKVAVAFAFIGVFIWAIKIFMA